MIGKNKSFIYLLGSISPLVPHDTPSVAIKTGGLTCTPKSYEFTFFIYNGGVYIGK
jgi:hypothetical protein